jgi:hypothetical protein
MLSRLCRANENRKSKTKEYTTMTILYINGMLENKSTYVLMTKRVRVTALRVLDIFWDISSTFRFKQCEVPDKDYSMPQRLLSRKSGLFYIICTDHN